MSVPGAEYTPRYVHGQWDGTYAPGKWCRRRPGATAQWEMRASRGLLGRLAATLPIPLIVDDRNGFTARLQARIDEWSTGHLVLASLRDYQQQATSRALTEQWGRIALATNAGKGAVAALLAQFALVATPVLILCDELAVFDALLGELEHWAKLRPGLVGQGVKSPPADAVALAMVPTLARRLSRESEDYEQWAQWVAARGMVLLDEADKATAATWRLILRHCTKSYWRVGFSGTFPSPAEDPYSDLRLDELMGPVLIHAKNIELVHRGVSARPGVILHSFDVTGALAHPPRDWFGASGPARRQWVFEQAIVYNVARHHYIAGLVRPDTPTALVVNHIEHGHALAAAVPGSVFLDGSASEAQRREVLERFQRGELRVLVVTKILDRGTNRLGGATDLLFVSGEGSSRQTLQRIGRGLRRTGGKEFLRLVDVVDRVEVDPAAPRFRHRMAAYIHGAARKRIALYHAEQFDVEVMATG